MQVELDSAEWECLIQRGSRKNVDNNTHVLIPKILLLFKKGMPIALGGGRRKKPM